MGSNVIKQIALKMCDLSVLNSIVILKGTTSIARKELEQLQPCRIEIFQQEELAVNITEHNLVPQHVLLT